MRAFKLDTSNFKEYLDKRLYDDSRAFDKEQYVTKYVVDWLQENMPENKLAIRVYNSYNVNNLDIIYLANDNVYWCEQCKSVTVYDFLKKLFTKSGIRYLYNN